MTDLIPSTIETDRLRLEVVQPETVDVRTLYEVCSAAEMEAVTEYMPWESHETPNETLEFVEDVAERYESNDGASYMVRPREGEPGAGEIAGTAGFGIEWEKRTLGMGVWLRKPFWGRGYSGERAAAFLALAFDRLDLDLVATVAHEDNDRSLRAIEKYVDRYGGRCEGLLRNYHRMNDEPADCYRYSISRSEWEEAEHDLTVRFED